MGPVQVKIGKALNRLGSVVVIVLAVASLVFLTWLAKPADETTKEPSVQFRQYAQRDRTWVAECLTAVERDAIFSDLSYVHSRLGSFDALATYVGEDGRRLVLEPSGTKTLVTFFSPETLSEGERDALARCVR